MGFGRIRFFFLDSNSQLYIPGDRCQPRAEGQDQGSPQGGQVNGEVPGHRRIQLQETQ